MNTAAPRIVSAAASTSAGVIESAGAGHDDDGVVAGPVVDEDIGGAGRLVRRSRSTRGVIPSLFQVRERDRAELVLADLGDEGHLGADARRGDRLVRALAARAELEARADDGLADLRLAPGAEREVGDEDAEDGDAASSLRHGASPLRPRRAG